MDVDGDGVINFYINGHYGELGFSPIPNIGCFSGSNSRASFGAREMKRYEAGELLQFSPENRSSFIESGRTSAYSISGGFAEGWNNLEDVYIGFLVIENNDSIKHGWLKMAVDVNNQQLIIKEIAYTEAEPKYAGSIMIGDLGEGTEKNFEQAINDLTISPNPACDWAQLKFEYSGTEPLSVVVQNSIGQEIYRNLNPISAGHIHLRLSTTQWLPGLYYVRFENDKGVRTELLSVAR